MAQAEDVHSPIRDSVAEARPSGSAKRAIDPSRRAFIGGSDARIIMGQDEEALMQLWREKRGEAEPEDLSGNLIVQLGIVTEHLNRSWYERQTGKIISSVQRRVKHPVIRWMAATLDGVVQDSGVVFEAKFMLPWHFSEEAAAEKYMPQLQHNMRITNATTSVLSIITGGGKWVEITIDADSLYQHLLLTAEKKFWRCVESGEPPRLYSFPCQLGHGSRRCVWSGPIAQRIHRSFGEAWHRKEHNPYGRGVYRIQTLHKFASAPSASSASRGGLPRLMESDQSRAAESTPSCWSWRAEWLLWQVSRRA
jgi:hypothetical protein